ncbi:cation diffusion facilitator family transporter [Skermanella sp. TT6]|uniref:Cation diffusion facilitator family transporter n=1 Tax=Skermanella cutis TaxID=2775420 RepID=A0ABX7B447_9PROT|nr:cation diffusion facilitator family transporter [Skermanella sp. TT6]QQP88909.1 cation diffusion facilitator family transporter [Skermanella sp. TT6]
MGSHSHHDHGGGHGHAHAHAHAHSHSHNERRLLLALLLTGSFMVVEAAGGILAGSLALLADAGHMLTDTAALALSWYAFRVGRRPATADRSYGQHRFQVLAALINGATLIAVAAWIVLEAAERLLDPVPVMGTTMLAIAAAGLAVNVAAFLILHGGDQRNLNMRGAALHVLGDLLGSVAAIVAAGVILWTGWTPIDPILSVLVALLILRSAWALVARSWHVLMEGTPEGLDIDRLSRELADAVPGVADVHHVHAWSLTPDRPLITFHASLAAGADHDEVLRRLRQELAHRFDIEHSTIQLERDPCQVEPCRGRTFA